MVKQVKKEIALSLGERIFRQSINLAKTVSITCSLSYELKLNAYICFPYYIPLGLVSQLHAIGSANKLRYNITYIW
jgi:hypothetical protein